MRQTPGSVTRFLSLAGLAVGALALAACAPAPEPEARSSAPAPAESQAPEPAANTVDPNAPVLVALLVPTNAADERTRGVAEDLTAAAQMARIDARDPLIRLKVYDTRGEPGAAAVAARRALDEGAAIILGPLAGASADTVGPVAAAEGVNVLAFTNDSTVAGGNVWALGQRPEQELRRILAFAAAQGLDPIGLAYPADRYGDLVMAEAEAASRDIGVRITPFVRYERSFEGIEAAAKLGAEDMLYEIASRYGSGAVKPAGYDSDDAGAPWRPSVDVDAGMVIADGGDGLRAMASFLRFHDVRSDQVRFLGLSRHDDRKNLSESSLADTWFAAADPDAAAGFAQRFEASMGRAPHPLAALGYDAVAIAGELLAAARATGDRSAFAAEALARPQGFAGATGPLRLTADGLNARPLAVMRITPGGMQVIDPAPAAGPGA